MGRYYRSAHQFFISNRIFFNHESPRRSLKFVTGKIVKGLVDLIQGKISCLELGNIYTERDFGFAPDYIEAMWQILQFETSLDWVIGTGESHSIKEFIQEACAYLGVGIAWEGLSIDEVATLTSVPPRFVEKLYMGQQILRINPDLFRPVEICPSRAEAKKAKELLGWSPKVTFQEMVKILVDAALIKNGLDPMGEGASILHSRYPYIEGF